MLRWMLVSSAALGMAACSIHPIPDDVTGLTTEMIVARIRCEARDAVRYHAREFIKKRNAAIAAELERDPERFAFYNRNRHLLDAKTQVLIEAYDQGAIVYDFTFDMTENNNLGGEAGFEAPFTRGPFSLGFKGKNDRQRQNIRTFRIKDNFEEIATRLPVRYCPTGVQGPNWWYPITGTIGLQELLGTFLQLHATGALKGPEEDKPPAMGDTIEFVTVFSGSASPSIEFGTVGRGLQLTKASLTGEVARQDKHKVLVGLSLPKDPDDLAPRVRGPGAQAARPAARSAGAKRTAKSANDMVDYMLRRNTETTLQQLQRRLDAVR